MREGRNALPAWSAVLYAVSVSDGGLMRLRWYLSWYPSKAPIV
jgi:hypothetical protein